MAADAGGGNGDAHRGGAWTLLGPALGLTAGVLVLLLLPDLLSLARSHLVLLVPIAIRAWGPLACLAAASALLAARPARVLGFPVPARWWARLEGASALPLRGWLSAGLGVACAWLLAGWLPSYLCLPLWTDSDQFAVSAQAWDAGILPYRDLPDFDFPGPIYLFWTLGKLFGWGKPPWFYAVDAALLVLLGAALLAWSRRLFGVMLPGWVGFLLLLCYYLGFSFALTAQRDWQAALAVTLGLLALSVWPGPAGRLLSASATAVALSYRPQVVLFLPALWAAVAQTARRPGKPPARVLRELVTWSAMLGLCTALAFAPLLFAGVLDDFLRVLRMAQYGSSYNRATPGSIGAWLLRALSTWQSIWVLGALGVLAGSSRRLRGPAITWALALAGALLYKPLSPIPHDYLDLPLVIVRSVGVALVVGWLLGDGVGSPSVRLLLVIAVLVGSLRPTHPRLVSPGRTLSAAAALWRGEAPSGSPPGCMHVLPNRAVNGLAAYSWEDYQEMLSYLRRTTGPRTRVADFLRRYPYPTVNGSVGRLSPFPAAGGVLWLEWVAPGDRNRFLRSVEQAGDSVVVWVPREKQVAPPLRLERMQALFLRLYEPEARFGSIEVWRRKPARRAETASRSSTPR